MRGCLSDNVVMPMIVVNLPIVQEMNMNESRGSADSENDTQQMEHCCKLRTIMEHCYKLIWSMESRVI